MANGEKLTNAERQQRYRDRRNILADSADLKPLTLQAPAIAPGTREYAALCAGLPLSHALGGRILHLMG